MYDSAARAQDSIDQHTGIPGKLREQRPDPRESVGLLLDVRPREPDRRGQCGHPQFPGHLSEPATGQGAAQYSPAKCYAIRNRIRRDQVRTSRRRGYRPVAFEDTPDGHALLHALPPRFGEGATAPAIPALRRGTDIPSAESASVSIGKALNEPQQSISHGQVSCRVSK